MNMEKIPMFGDHAGSLYSTIALTFCTCVFLLFVQATMINSGFLADISPASINYYKLPLAAGLIIFYFYVSLEYLEINRFALLFLGLWIVPILLAVFLAVAFEFEDLSLYLAAISPLTLTVLSVQGMAVESLRSTEFELIINAYWIGCGFILFVTMILAYRLKDLKDRTREK